MTNLLTKKGTKKFKMRKFKVERGIARLKMTSKEYDEFY